MRITLKNNLRKLRITLIVLSSLFLLALYPYLYFTGDMSTLSFICGILSMVIIISLQLKLMK